MDARARVGGSTRQGIGVDFSALVAWLEGQRGSMDIVEIEVINWEKYNPRTDRKKSSWFRLENGIAAEPKFFGLSAAQKFIAICLFAEASKKCGATASVNIDWLADQLKVKAQEIHKTIQHLVSSGVVKVSSGVALVSSGCPTNERTNERYERTNNNAHSVEFAEFYLGCPRKIGKAQALKAYVRERKAGATAEDLLAARDKFRAYHETQGTEPRFIPYPATMLSDWKQWLDPETGSSDLKTPNSMPDLSHIAWDPPDGAA